MGLVNNILAYVDFVLLRGLSNSVRLVVGRFAVGSLVDLHKTELLRCRTSHGLPLRHVSYFGIGGDDSEDEPRYCIRKSPACLAKLVALPTPFLAQLESGIGHPMVSLGTFVGRVLIYKYTDNGCAVDKRLRRNIKSDREVGSGVNFLGDPHPPVILFEISRLKILLNCGSRVR